MIDLKNRENNLKLLMEVQQNMVREYKLNLNFISKCKDIIVFCDFQINTQKVQILFKKQNHYY